MKPQVQTLIAPKKKKKKSTTSSCPWGSKEKDLVSNS
jgi:hypothetical protein